MVFLCRNLDVQNTRNLLKLFIFFLGPVVFHSL